MSDPDRYRRVKMRFIGRPNGVLMKGAKSNYEHGKIYEVPMAYSHYPYWELVEPPPEIQVEQLKAEDSVFEESTFVPDEKADAMTTMPPELREQLYGDKEQVFINLEVEKKEDKVVEELVEVARKRGRPKKVEPTTN